MNSYDGIEREDSDEEALRDPTKDNVIYILRELIKAITSTLSLQKVSKRVYLYMQSKYGECTFGLAVNYPDKKIISDCFYYEKSDLLEFDLIKYSEGIENSSLLKAVLEKKPQILDSSTSETHTVYHGILPKASYFAPLIMNEEVIGAFTYQLHDRSEFLDEELMICKEITPFLSIALNNSLQTKKLIELNEKLKKLSAYDTLTEIYNRRYFYEEFENIYRRAVAGERKSYLFLMDLDNFKGVNDNFGHQAGDDALKSVAKVLKDVFSKGIIGRYGGDEFIAGIANISEKQLEVLVDNIDDQIFKLNIPVDKNGKLLSISKGIVKLTTGKALREYLDSVDKNLYKCKAEKNSKYYLSEV